MVAKLYTAKEVAELFGVSTSVIYHMIEKGQLIPTNVGGGRLHRFTATEIERYTRENTNGGMPIKLVQGKKDEVRIDTHIEPDLKPIIKKIEARQPEVKPVMSPAVVEARRKYGVREPVDEKGRRIVITTGHSGVIEWLERQGITGEIKEHVVMKDVYDRVVVGELSLRFMLRTRAYFRIEIPNFWSLGLRDLSCEEMIQNHAKLVLIEVVRKDIDPHYVYEALKFESVSR